jgi:GntR family transcriptional regulator
MPENLNKPLYTRIQEYIAELILSGKLKPDSKIDSEREFSETLGVSRMTVRKALTELVNEGLLERKHGSGTYVSRPKITIESKEMANYVEAMRSRNIATTAQLLEFSEMVASHRLSEILQTEIGAPLYHLVLLRFANRIPVILERSYFACENFPNMEDWDLEKTSLIDLLANVYSLRIGRISQTVEAAAASDLVAKQLRIDEGVPLLMLTRLIFNQDGSIPVVYSQDFLRSDYARIHTDINIVQDLPFKEWNAAGKEEFETRRMPESS